MPRPAPGLALLVALAVPAVMADDNGTSDRAARGEPVADALASGKGASGKGASDHGASAPVTAERDTGGLRIAVIDPNRIVEESPQYKDARATLSAEVKDREASLRQQQEEIDQLTARLERDAALMSADEAGRLQNDIRARARKLRYAKSEVQEEFALRQTDLRTKLVAQVEEVVRRLAKEKGIDLIVSEGVVFYSERVDISAEVIERLKAEFERR